MSNTSAERRRKTAYIDEVQHTALKAYIKQVSGKDVAEAAGVHENTIYRLSKLGHGSPETVAAVLKSMPAAYLAKAEEEHEENSQKHQVSGL